MAVVTITITESPIQVVAGIPKTIVINTNIPATVFYTLNGVDPTVDSLIVVGPITLPSNQNSVTFKALATDGIEFSPIVEYVFGPNWVGMRQPRDEVFGLDSTNASDVPFSSNGPELNVTYGNTAGTVVSSVGAVGVPDGYDGTATGTVISAPDLSYHRNNYDIVYSERNNAGQYGRGIGTLPAYVSIDREPEPPTISDANSKLFNPRALLILQDGREEPELRNPLINRQFFSLGNNERIRNGIKYNTTAFEGNVATGSFLRPQYNQKDNTWTFYYRDSETNRWIISTEPHRTSQNITPMRGVFFSQRNPAAAKVFKWFPFKRSHLR